MSKGSSRLDRLQTVRSFHNEHYRKLYGKMEKDQLRRLKTLEVENRRLKKIVADQALDLQIVKEALEGKY